MFKDRVGAMIISLYLHLHGYRARGGDLSSLIEEGKHAGAQSVQKAGGKLPLNVSDAKELLSSAKDTAQQAFQHPTQTADKVVEKVSEEVVNVAKTARKALRGENLESTKDVVKDAVESTKGEVTGAMEQAKKK